MLIHYKLTEEEMREFRNELLMPINNRNLARLIIFSDHVYIFIMIVTWALVMGYVVHPAYWLVIYGIIAVPYFFITLPIRLRRRISPAKRKISISPDYSKERTVKIDETGLIFESEGIHLYYPRNYIKDVKRLKKGLYILAAMDFGICIPYSAFSSQNEIDMAYSVCKNNKCETGTGTATDK